MAARYLGNLRYYSSQPTPTPSTAQVSALARRKWGLSGTSTPRSILNSDDPLPPSLSLSEPDISPNSRARPFHLRRPPTQPTPPEWKSHRSTLKQDFPSGWSPPRKLSRQAMDGLRELHRFDPQKFTTPVLAERFRVSPEAVRRILRSKWVPTEERMIKWVEKEKKARDERLAVKKLVLRKEKEEAKDIFLAKQFSGGLSLKG